MVEIAVVVDFIAEWSGRVRRIIIIIIIIIMRIMTGWCYMSMFLLAVVVRALKNGAIAMSVISAVVEGY